MSKNPIKPEVPRIHDDDVDPDDVPIVNATCQVCRIPAPPTRSAHTLISAQHGWRVARTKVGKATWSLNWFCGPCWKARTLGP